MLGTGHNSGTEVPAEFEVIGRQKFLYFETIEDILKDVIDLACILVCFSNSPEPKRKVLMPPEEEVFNKAFRKYAKSRTIAPFNLAIESTKKYVKMQFIKEIEVELNG